VGTESLKERYAGALTFGEMVDAARANVALWRGVHAHARVPEDALARVTALGGRWHLLVLSEDWCGDAVNIVPVIARLTELAPNVDMRLLARDQNLDLMDAHLTNGSRSIPYAIVLDDEYVERGTWGPRPRALQEWALGEGLLLPKEQRYSKVRQWYARDRGVTTLDELVTVLERIADVVPKPAPSPAARALAAS
jgi:hypothetical protein